MSSIEKAPQFVKPYWIEDLKEKGLTAKDIASALQVPLDSVHKKLKRNNWKSEDMQDWRVTPYVVLNKNNGLEVLSYALNVKAAKAFVARYSSKVGDAYLNFLFQCEAYALERAQTIRLASKQSRKGVRKGQWVERGTNTFVTPLFSEEGDPEEIQVTYHEFIPTEKLSTGQYLAAQTQWGAKSAKGIHKQNALRKEISRLMLRGER